MSKFDDVSAVLQTYFDALHYCDTEKLAAVFHPGAVYATADDGETLLHRTMEEYFPVVAKRKSPASRGEICRDEIDAIEFAGDNTAFARVRCAIGANDFVDFLTLVRTGGKWWIMAKVFQIIERKP